MPKLVQHEARREEVARAVWRTVARRGIDATTVRAVAREAGWSTGVLAHYFRDKDHLLVYALHLATRRAGARMARQAERGGDTALRAVLREALPLDDERRLEWRIWVGFWGRAAGGAALASEHGRRYVEWRGLVQALVRRGQQAGTVCRDVDARTAADLLVAFVDGLGMQATLEPGRLSPRRQCALLDRVLGRLAPE